jgi:type IV secretory pathway TraG/TraD family ATPase VirD4
MRMAHWLSQASRTSSSGGLQDAEFWHTAAEKLLAPLLYAAASGGGQMEEVIGWLNEGADAEPEVRERLSRTESSEEALSAWKANWNREERQRSSIYTTAETILAAFSDPRVLEVSKQIGYTPAALLDGKPNTLYLCAPAHEQERLRTLFAAMIAELVAVVYESSAQTGKPIDPPLLIVLDEAANIAPLPDLDVLASSGAGQKGSSWSRSVRTSLRSKRDTDPVHRRSSTTTAPRSSQAAWAIPRLSATSPKLSATASFASAARPPPSRGDLRPPRAPPTETWRRPT